MAKKIKHQTTRALTGWAFISPWVIGFLLFTLFPILMSLFLSFNDVVYGAEGIMLEFVGFKNYMNAFSKNMECLEAIVVFLKDSIFMVFIINVFAVLFAVLLNTNIKGRGFFRTLFFLPVVIVSGPVMNQLVANEIITMPNLGDLSVIRIIGTTFGPSIQELIVTSFSDLIYMFWFSGVQLIVYLSMIQKMDKSMYEAAEIDGASPWESFWKITLPSLKPVILINIIYTFILLASFDTNGVISVITETMKGTGTLGGAESFGYGLATAFSWIYFLILFLIVGIIFLVFYLRKKPKFSLAYNRERLGLPVNRYEKKVTKLNSNKTYKKVRRFFMGRKFSDGFFAKAFTYVLLTIVAFAFLYPFIDMLLVSLQSPEDVLNPMIGSLPSAFYIDNYVKAFKVLGFWKALGNSIFYSLVPTILQVIAAAFIGYGLAKFQFKGKFAIMILIVMTFIIPTQLTLVPTFMLYNNYLNMVGSVWTILLPAMLGQGLKSAIFI
jgi:ABC-type sugar transport system permease subunit